MHNPKFPHPTDFKFKPRYVNATFSVIPMSEIEGGGVKKRRKRPVQTNLIYFSSVTDKVEMSDGRLGFVGETGDRLI